MSSNKIFFVIFFVVLIGLAGGIGYMSLHPRSTKQLLTSSPSQQQPTSQINPSRTTTQTSPVIQAGASDIQLQQDSSAIDDGLNSLDTELTNVDNGLNDQPTNLQ